MNIQNGYGIFFNDWILDKNIREELPLLLLLSSQCASNGYCIATNAELAQMMTVCDSTISHHISTLSKFGYITVMPADQNSPRRICINRVANPGEKITVPAPATDSLLPTPPARSIADDFETFWKNFTPTKTRDGSVSKGSKKLARERYERIVKRGVSPDTILVGLKKYIEFCEQNDRFTCQAAVFLSQERWNDHLDYTTSDDNFEI